MAQISPLDTEFWDRLFLPSSGYSAEEALVFADVCQWVEVLLRSVGATEWARMLAGEEWNRALLDAQRPLAMSLSEEERLLVLTCFRIAQDSGRIQRASDSPFFVVVKEPLAPVDDTRPDVMGGSATPGNWGGVIAMLIILGTAWMVGE